ncbi:MAG: hypothetical protein QXN36_04105 [Candidatus Bathyarchaeia archaeon]
MTEECLIVECPKCGEKAIKHGKRDGIQRYRCKNKHVFTLEKPEKQKPSTIEKTKEPEQQITPEPQQEFFSEPQPKPEQQEQEFVSEQQPEQPQQPKQQVKLPPTPLHIFTPEYNPFVKWLFEGMESWAKIFGLIKEQDKEKQQKEYV